MSERVRGRGGGEIRGSERGRGRGKREGSEKRRGE